MQSESTYKEWRVLTPILLVTIVVSGAIVGWFCIDKLNSLSDMNKSTNSMITEMRNGFTDFKVETTAHLARIDQELIDFKPMK